MTDSEFGLAPQHGGLSRRELIKRGAVVGGVVWAAPVIDSFTSRAVAGSFPVGAFPCSYATIIFSVNGGPAVAVKLNDPTVGCNLLNTDGMYKSENLGPVCNGVQYAVDANNVLTANGTEIPIAPSGSCSLFTISGCTVTASSGVSILFVLIHDGSITNGDLVSGTTICGPGSSFTVPAGDCGC